MDLKAYLKFTGLTAKEFAKMAGLSQSTLCNYLTKKRLPDLITALEIERLSKGKVHIEDLVKYYKSGQEEK